MLQLRDNVDGDVNDCSGAFEDGADSDSIAEINKKLDDLKSCPLEDGELQIASLGSLDYVLMLISSIAILLVCVIILGLVSVSLGLWTLYCAAQICSRSRKDAMHCCFLSAQHLHQLNTRLSRGISLSSILNEAVDSCDNFHQFVDVNHYAGKIVKDSCNFQNDRFIWPEGYTAVRMFSSLTDPTVLTLYKMEVLRDVDSRSKPLFRATADNGEEVSDRVV